MKTTYWIVISEDELVYKSDDFSAALKFAIGCDGDLYKLWTRQ